MTPRARNWLHRIGYLTTFVVIVEIAALCCGAIYLWLDYRARSESVIAESRTQQGPLRWISYGQHPDEKDLLATIPVISGANQRGMRFIAAPSLRDPWYAYTLTYSPDQTRATGSLRIFQRSPDGQINLTSGRIINFWTSVENANRILEKIGRFADQYEGEASLCLDGTAVAFELVTATGTKSGNGNAGCSDHYANLSMIVLNSVRTVIPEADRPYGKDWRPRTINH